VYRYTYTDCAGHDSVYTLTRHVIPGSFSPVADKDTTIHCPSEVQEPVLPVIVSCGHEAVLTLISTSGSHDGCGDSTFTYQYEINGQPYTWNYTIHFEPQDFTIGVPNGRDTVACASAMTMPTLPAVTDACGRALTPVDTTVPAIPACDGSVDYIFNYRDCFGHTHPWTFT
jgi:hypothetical protein